MKSTLLIACIVGIATLCVVLPATAQPQRVYVQKLPYYPPPTRPPRPILVKRSADNAPGGVPVVSSVKNSVSGNLFTGQSNKLDGKVSQSETQFLNGVRTETSSGSVDWSNANGIGASLSRDINKGVSDTFTKSITANLFNNDKNRVDATFSESNVKLGNGFKYDKTSGLLNWSNSDGHGLNAGLSRYSGIGKQATATGYTNLFTSSDGNTKINAYGGGSQWLSGPFNNQRDYGFGIGGSHSFRG